jgi:hypothetical protein
VGLPGHAIIAQVVRRAVAIAATVTTGLLAGGMLLIRVVLVPFWRGIPPREFRDWFASHSNRIRGVMVPLGTAAATSSAITALFELAADDGATASSAMAAVSAAGVGAITYAVNEPANEQFVREDLDDDVTTDLLGRWSRWHDLRVVLGVVSALAAARTLLGARTRLGAPT